MRSKHLSQNMIFCALDCKDDQFYDADKKIIKRP